MNQYVRKTERKGFLVTKYNKVVSFIPWPIVYELYQNNIKGIDLELMKRHQVEFSDKDWLNTAMNRYNLSLRQELNL